jgi:hypothetical protein
MLNQKFINYLVFKRIWRDITSGAVASRYGETRGKQFISRDLRINCRVACDGSSTATIRALDDKAMLLFEA